MATKIKQIANKSSLMEWGNKFSPNDRARLNSEIRFLVTIPDSIETASSTRLWNKKTEKKDNTTLTHIATTFAMSSLFSFRRALKYGTHSMLILQSKMQMGNKSPKYISDWLY